LDRPNGTAAREHTGAAHDAAPAAQHTARPRLVPASAATLTGRTRASARGAGEAASATVELADGEPSGESNSTGMLPKSSRFDFPTKPKL